MAALGRARVGAVFAEPRAVALMVALGRETVAVARAAGVGVAEDAAEAYVVDARRRLPASGGSSTSSTSRTAGASNGRRSAGRSWRRASGWAVPVPVSRAYNALVRLLIPPAG